MFCSLILEADEGLPDYNDPGYYQETGGSAGFEEEETDPDDFLEDDGEGDTVDEGYPGNYEDRMNPEVDSDEMEEGLEMDED
ncbi:MAG: hypothetical protein ACR2PT_17375 [Endozoicomonas sp.]